MKNMILAASALGALIAGSILYMRKRAGTTSQISNDSGLSKLSDRSLHTMG